MPRFVILYHHQITHPHWDLMLEHHDQLITWQIPNDPKTWSPHPTPCTKIFDHRKKYLDYQGPLTNNRGQVTQSHTGHYTPQIITNTLWEVTLESQHLSGSLSLTHINDDQWQLYFIPTSNEPRP